MISIYAVAKVKADKTGEFEAIVKASVPISRQDPGCEFYSCGQVNDEQGHYAFVENWATMADFENHTQQPHFHELIGKLESLLSEPLDIKIVKHF